MPEKYFHVTTRVGDKTIAFQEPIDDPFVNHTVWLGWRDLLRGLLHRELKVTVIVDGHRAIVGQVLDLAATDQPA